MLLFICDRPTKKVTHRHPTSYKMKAWENESQVSRYEWILSSISTCENQQNLGLVISPAQNCPSRAHNRGYRRAASAPSSTKLLQKTSIAKLFLNIGCVRTREHKCITPNLSPYRQGDKPRPHHPTTYQGTHPALIGSTVPSQQLSQNQDTNPTGHNSLGA